MKQSISYLWRLIATGSAFTLFGLGGVIVPVLIAPILMCLPGGKAARQVRTRLFTHHTFRIFRHYMRLVGILRWEFEECATLREPGQLILANHPTLLDVVFLISLIPNANCVVKAELLKNPAMRGLVTMTGFIINSGGEQLVADACQSLDSGASLIIFPEGTRSCEGEELAFQRGAARIGLATTAPVLPVIIHCDPPTLSKQHRWYNIPAKQFVMTLRVLPQFIVQPYREANPAIAARHLTRDLRQHFTEALTEYGVGNARARAQGNDH